MQEGYWVIRTIKAGQVGEKTKFWVPGKRPEKSGRRTRSEIKKQEQNDYACVKTLARLINANFHPGDLLMGLDYNADGYRKVLERAEKMDADGTADEVQKMECIRLAAEAELRNALKRVKRELQKEGKELPYIAITSDMDGGTGESVRVHHHLLVPKWAKKIFLDKWEKFGMGGVSWTPLREQEDYLPIAEYFMNQVRRVPDAKKYIPSRNLIRPVPKDRIAISDAELLPPRGGKLLFRAAYKPGQPQYIRYILPVKRRE